jgi:predicted phosphodiesterase
MSTLRIIGDVHGKFQEYIALTKECDSSIQVGDMGFDYSELKAVDEYKHKFIGGNHDNYNTYYNSPHVKETTATTGGSKDFGTAFHCGLNFFFVRGGFSIDWKQRQKSFLMGGAKSYWDNEELSMEEMEMALWLYQKMKPDVVITHECPRSISKHVGDNKILEMFGYNPDRFTTKTSELLEMMFQSHQPKQWYFGHYHNNWYAEINGTQFRCIDELNYVDLEV